MARARAMSTVTSGPMTLGLRGRWQAADVLPLPRIRPQVGMTSRNGGKTRTLGSHRRRCILSELEAYEETANSYRRLAFVGRSPLHRGPNTGKYLLGERGSWVRIMQFNHVQLNLRTVVKVLRKLLEQCKKGFISRSRYVSNNHMAVVPMVFLREVEVHALSP